MKTLTAFSAALAATATTTAGLAVYGNRRLQRRLAAANGELADARYTATHDKLTGLVNRAGLDGHLALCAADDAPVWVLLVDLDGFKPVNDTYGHAAGDVVLTTIARRLHRFDNALAARLGGDEFVLVADNEADHAAWLAGEVVAAARRPITVRPGVQIRVTASVGWVQMRPGADPSDVLHTADTALYRAKAAGGDQAIAWGANEPLRSVKKPRPAERLRDAHSHRVPSELWVVVGR